MEVLADIDKDVSTVIEGSLLEIWTALYDLTKHDNKSNKNSSPKEKIIRDIPITELDVGLQGKLNAIRTLFQTVLRLILIKYKDETRIKKKLLTSSEIFDNLKNKKWDLSPLKEVFNPLIKKVNEFKKVPMDEDDDDNDTQPQSQVTLQSNNNNNKQEADVDNNHNHNINNKKDDDLELLFNNTNATKENEKLIKECQNLRNQLKQQQQQLQQLQQKKQQKKQQISQYLNGILDSGDKDNPITTTPNIYRQCNNLFNNMNNAQNGDINMSEEKEEDTMDWLRKNMTTNDQSATSNIIGVLK